VVFLDLEMPVMSGYEAAQRLRADERAEGRKRARLIAFSSNDDEATIKRALAAGCDHYLAKPAPREALWKLLAGGEAALKKTIEREPQPGDPVAFDVDLRATLPEYLAAQGQGLNEVAAALAGGDRVAAKRLAHRLAGSFALYGFLWASAQCRRIEREAAQGDAAALSRLADEVRAHLERADIQFVEA
jgi:CheY-like chemotaxis protein